eukprot:4446634-Amphidinium_carterae.2
MHCLGMWNHPLTKDWPWGWVAKVHDSSFLSVVKAFMLQERLALLSWAAESLNWMWFKADARREGSMFALALSCWALWDALPHKSTKAREVGEVRENVYHATSPANGKLSLSCCDPPHSMLTFVCWQLVLGVIGVARCNMRASTPFEKLFRVAVEQQSIAP